ncbi:aldehyde dehydrogenase family protein [Pseudonocardia aurantiaca]|uniref:Aldehyde dehydrogenase family protein n=1 Tax=Pseudonocardia aurantiaca TaxID=75290 RepID=A0ABW4FLH9_9PSEU
MTGAPPLTIDGRPVAAQRTFDVVDPALDQVTGQAPDCTPDQLEQAVTAAARAQREWRADEDARRKALLAFADAITAASDELTATLSRETGKPLPVAGAEPGICATWLRYYAGMGIPRELLQDDASARIELAHRPLGVVAAITPWNFPLGLAMWKIAPALLAGNTVVLKPSPFTPLSSLLLGEIGRSVLPPGVLNVVTGGDRLGADLVAHPVPRKVTFTGSVAGGKSVAVSAAADLKRVTLELGGNDAAILLPDADLATAVPVLVGTAFFNTGQACALPKRIFAPAQTYDAVVEAFGAAARAVTVGPPSDASAQLGPLSTRPQYERVAGLAADAVRRGARVVAGGHPVDGPGFFFEPTILADLGDDAPVVAEEQFGPVLPILRYGTVDEAVERANDTTFGLCGSAWGADEERAAAVAERLQCGTTFVNTHAELPPTVPFGGAKWSGVGQENGVAGLLAFTEPQVVHRKRTGALA